MRVHKDICIRFKILGRWFEAVGFLGQDETSVPGGEALQRCDNGHLVQSDEDWNTYFRHWSPLPQLGGRILVSARRNGTEGNVSSRRQEGTFWLVATDQTSGEWDDKYLVLRHYKQAA